MPLDATGMPDVMSDDATARRLPIGGGFIEPVPPAVWRCEVSGKQALVQWFGYRKKDRERPLIGDGRPASPQGEIQSDGWLADYPTELLNVLKVLTCWAGWSIWSRRRRPCSTASAPGR